MRRALPVAITLVTVVTLIVTATACDSSNPAAPNVPGGGTVTITANPNNTFSPANVTISVGDTVTFRNNGGNHNVAAANGSFRCANGCDGQGGNGNASTAAWSFTITFTQAEVVNFHCEPHQSVGMVGAVTVQ